MYAAKVEVEALSNAVIHRGCLSVSLSIRPVPLTQNLRVLDGYYRTQKSNAPVSVATMCVSLNILLRRYLEVQIIITAKRE